MTEASTPSSNPFWWPWPFPFGGIAPQSLTQPINPGWTFGNLISVTEQNSTAPDTERQIVSEQSYGRQIGRILDALAELIGEREGPPTPALKAALELRDKVDEIKARAAQRRLAAIGEDLATLKTHDPEAYERAVAALRRLIEP